MMLAVFNLSIDSLKEWALHHGWWGSAFASFSLLFACGLGLPLPEDIPLILTGALLCKSHDGMTAWQSWMIVGGLNWLGIICGDVSLYWISRHFGRGVTRLPVIGSHITLDRIDTVGGWFSHYGVMVVAVGRLIAGIRGAMVITAGITRFSFPRFLLADGVAAIFSGALFMIVGHYVGENLDDATIHKFKHYFAIGAVVLLAGVVAYIVWKRRRHATKTATSAELVPIPGTPGEGL